MLIVEQLAAVFGMVAKVLEATMNVQSVVTACT
jgi:hypothetical protein